MRQEDNMRKTLLATTVSVAALALSSSRPLVAQSDVDLHTS
jgi:hypothetical protein